MAFPVFAPGDVLTAADMNAVGLWLVKTQTIGTGVSSVQVTGAFSSTYENYLITVNGGVASTTSALSLTLGSTTANYSRFGVYGGYAGATVLSFNTNSGASWPEAVLCTVNSLHGRFELYGPNMAKNTHFISQNSESRSGGIALSQGGYLNDTTQYTSFTLTPTSGTLTGGTIRVYGYRN